MRKGEWPIEASYAESQYVQMSDYHQSQKSSKVLAKDANLSSLVDWNQVREQNFITKELRESQKLQEESLKNITTDADANP